MMSGLLVRSETTRQPIPAAINSAATMAEWCAGFGRGGRAERASMMGTRDTARPGHQAAAVAPSDGDEDDHRQQRPGQAEPVDAMADRGLERRGDCEPERETCDRSDQRADRADDRAVGQQHESKVLLGRADSSEHAELAEPSLRDHGEARGGDQRGQQQEDGRHREHRQRVGRPVALPSLGPRERGPAPLSGGRHQEGVDPAVDRFGAGVHQHRDVVRCSRERRGDKCELVAQIAWVLDDADDGPPMAVERKCLPELEAEDSGHAVGDGDLARPVRIAASSEREPCAPVRSARVLGAKLDLVDAARNRQRAVTDDVDRPEAFLDGGETRLQPARIGAVEPQEVTGRAELRIVRRTRVVGDRDAGDRGRDREGEEREHQDLLAPLASEQAPRPAHQRTARAIRRSILAAPMGA